jgi:lysozyme
MTLDLLTGALKGDEGFRDLAYDDANGVLLKPGYKLIGYPTIGYGWNLSSDKMPEPVAADMLRARALIAMNDAAHLLKIWPELDPVRQAVLANMAYNLGAGGLAGFRKMLEAVEGRRFLEAAAHGRDSAWFTQVKGRGARLMNELETGMV